MDSDKKTPLQRVAAEMADHSSESVETITKALERLLLKARTNAVDLMYANDSDQEMLEASEEYYVLAELVNQFGSALIAFDDIERDQMDRPPPEVIDLTRN